MKWKGLFCAAMVFFSSDAQAVVSLAGTRLVFDGQFRETSIEVTNRGDATVLIQAWLQDARPEQGKPTDLPFVVTPHLVQLPVQGRQTLRVLYEGVGMPVDRESVLHLYVLEVPRRSEARQQLSIAVRQRINVFYRPKGLSGDPAEAAQKLEWQWGAGDRTQLQVSNATPFHVSLQDLAIDGLKVSEDLMLEPFSKRLLTMPAQLHHAAAQQLTFKSLTDYGGQRDFCAQTLKSQPFNARLRNPATHSSIEKC